MKTPSLINEVNIVSERLSARDMYICLTNEDENNNEENNRGKKPFGFRPDRNCYLHCRETDKITDDYI